MRIFQGMSFQPILLIAPLIYVGIAWSIFSILRSIGRHPSFELSFLSLLALLNILAFLGGFSIGKLVAFIALLIGTSVNIYILIGSHNFKLEFIFCVLVSLLLLLFMFGVPVAESILLLVLFLFAIWEGWKTKFWTSSPNQVPAIVILACLFEAAIILPPDSLSFLLPLLSMAIAILLLIKSRKFLWQNLIIIIANILWLLSITIFLNRR
jgi:hypothetical protein